MPSTLARVTPLTADTIARLDGVISDEGRFIALKNEVNDLLVVLHQCEGRLEEHGVMAEIEAVLQEVQDSEDVPQYKRWQQELRKDKRRLLRALRYVQTGKEQGPTVDVVSGSSMSAKKIQTNVIQQMSELRISTADAVKMPSPAVESTAVAIDKVADMVELQVENAHEVFTGLTRGSSAQTTVSLKECGTQCTCSCHKRIRMRSPGFLSSFLGQLFAGYVGYPVAACAICSRSAAWAVRVQYTFPGYFLRRTLFMVAGLDAVGSPELVIRVPIRRPWSQDSLCYKAYIGDVDSMRDMLEKRLATPNELDGDGRTPFHYARWHYGQHLNLAPCKLLLQAGADLNITLPYGYDDEAGAYLQHFSHVHHPEPDIMALLPASDYPNDAPNLHKIILGITHQSMDIQRSHTSILDAIDRFGRTAAHWAALLDKREILGSLIAAGARLDGRDSAGQTPLHLAAGRSSAVCKMLLSAGVPVDAPDVDGQTPLFYARDRHVVKALHATGANMNARGNVGDTALTKAAGRNRYEIFQTLVAFGANTQIRDHRGYSLLRHALRVRADDTLELSMAQMPDYHEIAQGGSLWHVLADRGTSRAVVLLHEHLQVASTLHQDLAGYTALDRLFFRDQRYYSARGDYECDRPMDEQPVTVMDWPSRRDSWRFDAEGELSVALEMEEADDVYEHLMVHYPGLCTLRNADFKDNAWWYLFGTRFRQLFTRSIVLAYVRQKESRNGVSEETEDEDVVGLEEIDDYAVPGACT